MTLSLKCLSKFGFFKQFYNFLMFLLSCTIFSCLLINVPFCNWDICHDTWRFRWKMKSSLAKSSSRRSDQIINRIITQIQCVQTKFSDILYWGLIQNGIDILVDIKITLTFLKTKLSQKSCIWSGTKVVKQHVLCPKSAHLFKLVSPDKSLQSTRIF